MHFCPCILLISLQSYQHCREKIQNSPFFFVGSVNFALRFNGHFKYTSQEKIDPNFSCLEWVAAFSIHSVPELNIRAFSLWLLKRFFYFLKKAPQYHPKCAFGCLLNSLINSPSYNILVTQQFRLDRGADQEEEREAREETRGVERRNNRTGDLRSRIEEKRADLPSEYGQEEGEPRRAAWLLSAVYFVSLFYESHCCLSWNKTCS